MVTVRSETEKEKIVDGGEERNEGEEQRENEPRWRWGKVRSKVIVTERGKGHVSDFLFFVWAVGFV